MKRAARLKQLARALEDRSIVWYSPRGSDGLGTVALPEEQLAGAFSLYDSLRIDREDPDNFTALALEDLSLRRRLSREFDTFTEQHFSELKFRLTMALLFKRIIVSGKTPTVVAYEPHEPLMTLIQKSGVAEFLGNDLHMFHRMSRKPDIEKALHKRGVDVIKWRDIDDTHQIDALLSRYPSLVIRRDGGSSGKGIIRVDQHNFDGELRKEVWTMLASHLASVTAAEFHQDSVPLSISGVVFPSGRIAHFPVSRQLVGKPLLTNFEFGFCGNDYKYVESLPNDALDQSDEMLDAVGGWLAEQGYVGAFGVDTLYLPKEGRLLFTEVNPRFQATNRVLSDLAFSADQPDVIMEHLAAWLGLPFSHTLNARQWRDAVTPISQMCLSNTGSTYVVAPLGIGAKPLKGSTPPFLGERNVPFNNNVRIEMWPLEGNDVRLEPNCVLNRIVVPGSVLEMDGFTLTPVAQEQIRRVLGLYSQSRPHEPTSGHPSLGREFAHPLRRSTD